MGAFDDTLGAVLIGVVIAAVLYGFTCVQTWYYFTHYPSDIWYIKFFVAAALIFDTCHQTLITHVAYTYLVTYYGQNEELGRIVWSMTTEVFFNTFTTLIVQCFLAIRVWRLSDKSWLATGPVIILIVAEFLASFIFAVQAVQLETYAQLATLKGLSMAVNVLAAAGDLLIALMLCRMLQLSRTGFRSSDTLINKLMLFSINTGLVTSLCAVASLISISVWPNAFIYIAFYFSIGRLYCNTLLATLNARKSLNSTSQTHDAELSIPSQDHVTQQKTSRGVLGTSSKRVPNRISIKIDTTMAQECTQFERDSGSTTDMKNPNSAVA